MLQGLLSKLMQRQSLTRDEAALAMRTLMGGEASPALVGSFLTALRMKGETADEITGLAETMRALATPIETSRRPLVDTCGTGGDRSGTFNISTTAAFVVAGASIAVAKHGNRSATSQCGSADVLESLGVDVNMEPGKVGKCIDDIGIGFLFARTLHGAMKHVGPIRAELKIRTVFNLLGPLTNPANADGQVVGVFDKDYVEPLAHVLQNLGIRHAFVVAGSDGLDEITTMGTSLVAEAKAGTVNVYEFDPSDYGFSTPEPGALDGGDAQKNASILRSILEGEEGPRRDIVVLNAAAAIQAGEGADDWVAAIVRAKESIDSGAALGKLEALIKASQ